MLGAPVLMVAGLSAPCSSVGRHRKLLNESSEGSKLRRTKSPTVSNTGEELMYATSVSCNASEKRDATATVKEAMQTTT